MAYQRVPATPIGAPLEDEEPCITASTKGEVSPRQCPCPDSPTSESQEPAAEAGGSAADGCGQTLVVLGVVAWNFSTSILLVNSVKYIYVTFHFRYPLFIAACHMIFSWAACALVMQRYTQGKVPSMTLAERLRRVLPFAIFGAASIGCGNMALTFLYPSFHEMLQATTPLFTLVTSVVLCDKTFNSWACIAMLPLCGGAVLSSTGEANFSWPGVVLSLAAIEFRSLRAVLQGRLLCDGQVDSVTLCYYMSPFNLVIFGLWGAAVEGWAPWQQLANNQQPFLLLALAVSAGLACSFNLASFLTIRYLNAIGAVVVQNAKTPATILLSLAIFKNQLTPQQVLGFGVTFFGVWLYGKKGKGR